MDPVLLTRRPRRPLAASVDVLWYSSGYQTARHTERVLPDGRFHLVINLSAGRAAVAGMRSRHSVIEPRAIQSVMGVIFWPGGARRFFAESASAFYNQVVPLDAVSRSLAARLCERLHDAVTVGAKFDVLETALLECLRAGDGHSALHASIPYALRAFHHVPQIRTVVDVSRETGLSRRRFSQLFREHIGMTPKLYCRLMRFREVVRQVAASGSVDWADVASGGGYCDQAHLTHDFRDFSGLSPSRYLAAERPFPNHVRVD